MPAKHTLGVKNASLVEQIEAKRTCAPPVAKTTLAKPSPCTTAAHVLFEASGKSPAAMALASFARVEVGRQPGLDLDNGCHLVDQIGQWHDLVAFLLDDDDDDELVHEVFHRPNKRRHGGGVVGRKMVKRDIASGHSNIMRDYLSPDPTYGETLFRRRFRMSSAMFRRIVGDLESDSFFAQRRDRAGRLGASPEQKITFALRMLAYGTPADAHDEYLRLSETTGRRRPEKT
ncbi:hypothetical protein SDRG_06975 [Saprolegnia diclina VS20]|uniref:Uncharacterized protein n=1 Tax=Saprolegnia diclina (strain VS20) TaxID=1156394 RepID=T0QPA9_SAPDV|nr:hypothetical protein SDRG_06975 [Saprolegnia diclina VS20]EQC35695.1 hypothetical protein SDRG_06975 [Saprolegnia diclina VS20]|eukprot:XP_008611012.1 hypothetical protein SDRG_06975 [Saprolegnia diclina VS20]